MRPLGGSFAAHDMVSENVGTFPPVPEVTYKATRSGNPAVAFCDRAPYRCDAKTPTLMRFFAQLNVSRNRSSGEGAMAVVFSGAARLEFVLVLVGPAMSSLVNG